MVNSTLMASSMTKQFYYNAISFLGLTIAFGLIQSLLYFKVGVNLLTLPSFANIFLTGNLIWMVSAGFLLQYYFKRQYWASFSTGLLAAFASLLRAILVYCQLVPLTRSFESYYVPCLFLDMGAGILYAGSLVLSETGRSFWLKAAGLCYLLLGFSTLVMLIYSIQNHLVQPNATLETIQQWISLAGSLSPLFFIRHFWRELQFAKSVDTLSSSTWAQNLVDLARFIGVGALLMLGVSLFGESIKANEPSAKARQMTQLFEARTFTNLHGDTLSYRLLRPTGYDFTQKYPLVVSLHGGAGCGTDNIRQLDNWEAQQLAKPENQKKYPAFVLVPQCSRGSSWGGLPRLIAKDSLVFEVMSALEKEFSIDTHRRYVAGGSLGGYGTWYFIGTRPGMFAAALPMCGEGNPALAKNMVDVAVWAFHGEKDKNVPVEGSRVVIKAIQQAGGHPRYTEFPGVAHNLWPELSKIPNVFDWLFAQKRDVTISNPQ